MYTKKMSHQQQNNHKTVYYGKNKHIRKLYSLLGHELVWEKVFISITFLLWFTVVLTGN